MADIVQKLTASGGAESAGFLNDIIAALWPNINVAGSRMVKEIAEPMFKSMLPGTLSTLHFVKIDLGPVPLKLSNVDVHKTQHDGIKLDLDLDWDGKCDIELDAKMMPKIGVEHVKLSGRLSVLLCPLTNIIPLIGAAQVAFINPPSLKLDFTDAANVADFAIIDNTIRKVMLNIIAGMAVLPNRFLVKIDPENDYFKTYQYHQGILRLTIEKGQNLGGKASKTKNFLKKLVKDVPDCYCKVNVSAEEEWKTSTQDNNHHPTWNETHDFLVTDHDQGIVIDVQDEDIAGDDDIGVGVTTVKQLLLSGGKQELALTHKEQTTEANVTISSQFYTLTSDHSSFKSSSHEGEHRLCGLATILIASAFGIEGKKEDLKPSIKVAWGKHEFRTPIKSYSPGMDMSSPSFDSAFRIPLTTDEVSGAGAFKMILMDGEQEKGEVEIPWDEVTAAEGALLAKKWKLGASGAEVRASVRVMGLEEAKLEKTDLPVRQ